MANQTVSQPSEKIFKYVAQLESVADAIDAREEQLFALVSTILTDLTPADEKNIPDGHPLSAWRLAQVLENMLGSTSHRRYVRETLLRAA